MRRIPVLIMLCVASAWGTRSAGAQEPPPRIPIVAVDLHATLLRFPENLRLAQSRNMTLAELPGVGLGFQVALTFYPVRWRAITLGVGGELAAGRARQQPPAAQQNVRAATEKFLSVAPQLSFNFGTGRGWSYVSGGLGQSVWSIVPRGQEPFPVDTERLRTINYGGGARWFAKTHVAFSFDVRFYGISPGTPSFGFPGSPRMTLLVIGAGLSLK